MLRYKYCVELSNSENLSATGSSVTPWYMYSSIILLERITLDFSGKEENLAFMSKLLL